MPENFSNIDLPLVNTEKLSAFAALYKFPLVFGSIGIILLASALGIMLKRDKTGSEIVFSTDIASTSASARKIFVDIAGAVMVPGVYEFLEGDRVSDALSKAGGLAAKADREWTGINLNLAARLVDGGKLYIPYVSEKSVGSPAVRQVQVPYQQPANFLGVVSGKVNINLGSQKELEDLPGVGPVTAGKIISGRPYQSIEELKDRKILGTKLFEKVRDLISVM